MRTTTVRQLGAVTALFAGLLALAPLEADAITKKPKVPGKPTIVVVEAMPTTKNRVHIRVIVKLPKFSKKTPITGTRVVYGNRSCNIRKTRTSCVMKNVQMGIFRTPITARSKNKTGFGKSSSRVRFTAIPGRWVRTGYSASGVKLPKPINSVANARQLSRSEKWTKMEAIQTSAVGSASRREPVVWGLNAPTITFRTDGVVGLATSDGSAMTSSGLYAVRSDGSSIDAIATGSADIQDFYVAPNNRYYVVFKSPVELSAGQPTCVLAEVDADTGNPRCVDHKVGSMFNSGQPLNMLLTGANPVVQFDDQGNIYYVANLYQSGDSCQTGQFCQVTWKPTLRKSVNGQVVSLLSDYVDSFDFLVQGDGSVFVSGMTNVTVANWTRRISPTGQLSTIDARYRATFLKKFADGNIYMGMSTMTGMGVRRYLIDSATLDPKWWITNSYAYGSNALESHFPASLLCSGTDMSQINICSSLANIKYAFNFGNSKTIVVGGAGMNSSQLVQYYPTPELIPTSLANITITEKVGEKIALAGTTSDGVNSLIIFDPMTLQETVVIDASNQIEIYSMAYVARTGKLMFNGLDFATNSYVMGEITIP